MCNLYSLTKGQQAIHELTRAMRDVTGNLPLFPGVFPDYAAPIVRNTPDGVRELSTAHWGMPVILTNPEENETWLTASGKEALDLQKPLPDDSLRIVARGQRQDRPAANEA